MALATLTFSMYVQTIICRLSSNAPQLSYGASKYMAAWMVLTKSHEGFPVALIFQESLHFQTNCDPYFVLIIMNCPKTATWCIISAWLAYLPSPRKSPETPSSIFPVPLFLENHKWLLKTLDWAIVTSLIFLPSSTSLVTSIKDERWVLVFKCPKDTQVHQVRLSESVWLVATSNKMALYPQIGIGWAPEIPFFCIHPFLTTLTRSQRTRGTWIQMSQKYRLMLRVTIFKSYGMPTSHESLL